MGRTPAPLEIKGVRHPRSRALVLGAMLGVVCSAHVVAANQEERGNPCATRLESSPCGSPLYGSCYGRFTSLRPPIADDLGAKTI